VSPTKDRQRAAARARLEREMAERAAAASRRRKRGTVIGAAAAVVVVLALVIWLVATAGGGKKKPPAAAPSASTSALPTHCTWKANPNPSASPAASQAPNPNLKDVGTPPASGEPRSGVRDMTIKTNLGDIVIRLDLAKAPCTAASMTYLADKHFYDNTSCHRLVNQTGQDQQTGEIQEMHVLQCGDPSGTGQGGPKYQFDNEYVPTDLRPAYPAGSVAMANSGPNTNGSQFFIVFGDTLLPGDYTLFGTVVSGLDVAKQVGTAGDDGAFAQQAGGGHPKKKITFNTVTVGQPQASAPPTSAAPSPSKS
jgi:peptidyl-prolyl cis-trans isomerase B (cyclophilin B)